MRLSNLKIENYRQFKDLELDLTYPAGHKKEASPLDKVCFIGQSGTGKTTLLKAIFDMSIPSLANLTNSEYKLQVDLKSHFRGTIVHDNLSYSKSMYNTPARRSVTSATAGRSLQLRPS